MKNDQSKLIILTLAMLTSWAVQAGTVGTDFTPSGTLTAGQMTEIKEAVNDNDTNVNTNATGITTNATAIGGNTTAIGAKQNRVNGVCPPGESIGSIDAQGTVTCEVDNDTLSTLSCSANQQIKWDGTSWICTGQVTKRFHINTHGTYFPSTGATYVSPVTTGGSIDCIDSNSCQINFNFMVPDDNVDGNDLVLEVTWKSTGTSGAVSVFTNWGTRQRVGELSTTVKGINGGAVDTSTSAVNTVFKSEITLQGTDFHAGDYITYGIFRLGGDTSVDNIIIGGLSVRYTAFE